MKRLLVAIFIATITSTVYATDVKKQLSHEYNLTFQQFLREKIVKLPKNAVVDTFLKNGTVVRGTYRNFNNYDDTFWVLPLGKRWKAFSTDAYDISEILDVRIVILKNI